MPKVIKKKHLELVPHPTIGETYYYYDNDVHGFEDQVLESIETYSRDNYGAYNCAMHGEVKCNECINTGDKKTTIYLMSKTKNEYVTKLYKMKQKNIDKINKRKEQAKTLPPEELSLEELHTRMKDNEKIILKNNIDPGKSSTYETVYKTLPDDAKNAVQDLVKINEVLKTYNTEGIVIELMAKNHIKTHQGIHNVDVGLNHGFNIDFDVMELVKLASKQSKEGGKYRRKTSKSRKSGKKAKKSKRKTKSKRRSRK
jgi:hypothetical protein